MMETLWAGALLAAPPFLEFCLQCIGTGFFGGEVLFQCCKLYLEVLLQCHKVVVQALYFGYFRSEVVGLCCSVRGEARCRKLVHLLAQNFDVFRTWYSR